LILSVVMLPTPALLVVCDAAVIFDIRPAVGSGSIEHLSCGFQFAAPSLAIGFRLAVGLRTLADSDALRRGKDVRTLVPAPIISCALLFF